MNTDDPRVGSARDGEQSPSASRLHGGRNSSSLDTLVATLVPVIVYSSICILIFIALRKRCARVYAPRATLRSLHPSERSVPLPGGILKWIKPFYRASDSLVLNYGSIDGFLFLRFLRILVLIFGVGCLLISPVLMPIHALGGAGNRGLDILTMGNITSKQYYFAHAAMAWVFFGFILFIVTRECIFCINLRHACLTSPFYADRLSAKTVLITCVPHEYLSDSKLRETFGGTVDRMWLPKDYEGLQDLVSERHQTAVRLEKAEVRLIRMSNMARSRALGIRPERKGWFGRGKIRDNSDGQSNVKDEETPIDCIAPLPDVNGSVASQWISHSSRPVHRPLANAMRRVDTIKWTRNRLKALARRILKERLDLLQSTDKPVIPAAFIEFETQADAQAACQTLSFHQPLYMAEKIVGVRPSEIIWDSLSLAWWSRLARKFAMQAFIAVMVIFWSLPCALVGMISNIEYVSSKIAFLGWVMDLPDPILGVLTGLVPALALAWLMSIVPWIIRCAARVAGTPTLTMIEVYTQKAYIIFQIVQVFLVTTLTSAVSAALTQILEDPMSATTLLSQNLPKSSNFYISYILVQSLIFGAAGLAHFIDMLRHYVFPLLPHDYRRRYERYHTLQPVHWGAIYPVFTNLGIIGISYACIAPLVLAFGTVGLAFLYLVYRYNVFYVFNNEIDTRGLLYPHALLQLVYGLYIAEVCLIGLFALKAAAGPIGMTAALLVVTILVHRSLLEALGPLLFDLPKSLAGTSGDPFAFTRPRSEQGPEDGAAFDGAAASLGPFHKLFGDIAPEDNADHVPGSARNAGHAAADSQEDDPHTESPTNTRQRYTISYGLPSSPSSSTGRTLEPSEKIAIHAHASSPETMPRGLNEPIPTAATEPFRLEGALPLLKTFYTGGSTLLSKQLEPYRVQVSGILAPLTTHPRYSAALSRLRRSRAYLSPLYYAHSPYISQLVSQLRDRRAPQYPAELSSLIYLHPSMYAPAPHLWIPRDVGGVSRQECDHNERLGQGVVRCSDEDWTIDELGRLHRTLDSTDLSYSWAGQEQWRGMW
jgi:calcium permeable stress-gated cation channel